MLTEFQKFDEAKPRYDLLPPVSLLEIVNAFTHGACKYADNNWWLCTEPQRYIAPLLRHIERYRAGESYDLESGCHHLSSAVFCAMVLMEIEMRHLGTKGQITVSEAYAHGLKRTEVAIRKGLEAKQQRLNVKTP